MNISISLKEDAITKIGMIGEEFIIQDGYVFKDEPFIEKHWWGLQANESGWYQVRRYYDSNKIKLTFCASDDESMIKYMKKQHIYSRCDVRVKDLEIVVRKNPYVYFYLGSNESTPVFFDEVKDAEKEYKKWTKKLKLKEVKKVIDETL